MIIEYIDVSPLSVKEFRDKRWGKHYMRQLVRLYLQFYELTFDRIGSLTLGNAGEDGPGSEPWVFGTQRPLQSTISEQTLADQNPSAIIPPTRTYTSAIDYYYAVIDLAFNDFVQSRDGVRSEENAREDLYDLHNFRSEVIDWIRPEYNYGPYYLMHGDLLPSNILVDSHQNIVAILDWEWCSTVPAQLLVPPAWITGFDITQVGCGCGIIGLAAGTGNIELQMFNELGKITSYPYSHPFSKLWIKSLGMET